MDGARATRRRPADVPVQLSRILVLAAFFGLWYLIIYLELVRPLYMPSPVAVLRRFPAMLQEAGFWRDMLVTMRQALSGWVIGSSLGAVVGLTLGYWNRAARVMSPYLTLANATPKVAFAPLIILWFGIGETSKVVLAAVIVFFIVQVPTQAAVALVDQNLEKLATVLGATQLQQFTKVILPATMAAVLGALRLSAVYAVLGVVLGEFIASREGLGRRLITATNSFDVSTGFATLLVLALLALGLNGAIGVVERRALAWRSAGTSRPVTML